MPSSMSRSTRMKNRATRWQCISSQDGLGLPDRDFYFSPEAGVAKIRTEYVSHLHNMLKLLGSDDASATKGATDVMAFETALAKVSRKLEDLRDPQRNYN